MKWSKAATELFEKLLHDVDPAYKEQRRHHATQEIEAYCEQTRIREVGSDQVIIGYIRATPANQRMGLRTSLLNKGVFVQKYDPHFFSQGYA